MININNMKKFRPKVDDPNEIPKEQGVYIISIESIDELPESMKRLSYNKIGERLIVYVGLSRQGIKSRDYRNHFNGTARVSTLRKSLGSLLGLRRELLDEKGRYRFVKEDEVYLTNWMKDNLFLHYCLCDDIEEMERELIEGLNPPLNLKDNHNEKNSEFRKYLRKQRKNDYI